MPQARLTVTARCPWCGTDPLYVRYHDEEWGVPVHDDRTLFELLVLEGAQAGLSWLTVLRRRAGFRSAFAGFDPERVARFDGGDVDRLLGDAAIIRNRLKIEAAIGNARAFLEVRQSFGTFDSYLWRWVEGEPLNNRWRTMQEVPAATDRSRSLSRDLKARSFRFVGPTIVYAFMQSVGMVNDHLVSCYRHRQLAGDG